MNSASTIINRVRSTKTLPATPTIMVKIIELSNEINQSSEDLIRAIKLDQALTSNILRLSNSAEQAFGGQVESIEDAVFRLGFHLIHERALSICAKNLMNGSVMDKSSLLHHSIATAIAAKNVGQAASMDPDIAYTSGLLHDIGKLVISQHIGKDAYQQLCKQAFDEKISLNKLEFNRLGTDHSEISYQLLDLWKTPDHILSGIENHHNPEKIASQVIQMADIIAYSTSNGYGSFTTDHIIDEKREDLAISETDMKDIIAQSKEQTESELKWLGS